MKQINIETMSHIRGGWERGPIGERICSSASSLSLTIAGIIFASYMPLSAFILGVAGGCYISEHY